jgi:hypothetical protein
MLPLASPADAAPGGVPAAGESFAGLARGSVVDRWTVVHVAPLECGGRVLTLAPTEAPNELFEIEVLARDPAPGAATPPGSSNLFAVFVRIGASGGRGGGRAPTVEDHGLAARAIASYLVSAEHAGDVALPSGLMTHAERTRAFEHDLSGDARSGPPRLLR